MKRFLLIILSCTLFLSACERNPLLQEMVESEKVERIAVPEPEVSTLEIPEEERGDDTPYEYLMDFDSLDDSELDRYVQDSLYLELVSQLDSDKYFVENISTSYISQEYIDELEYNSKPNIYFGYTLEEINSAFEGTRYVFTLGEEGETIAVPFEDYDDTYEQVLKNVAIGTGVILLSVTVTLVTGGTAIASGGAPLVNMIFSTSATKGKVIALATKELSKIVSGILNGIETGDMKKSLKDTALAVSEDFMWGVIAGVINRSNLQILNLKGVALNGAQLKGLTTQLAAYIQKESKFPIELIEHFHNEDEYNVFKAAGLIAKMINGKLALVRNDINFDITDDFGRSNLERMNLGLAALDESGKAYELHQIGEEEEASLAILTSEEQQMVMSYGFNEASEIDRVEFAEEYEHFWKSYANVIESEVEK